MFSKRFWIDLWKSITGGSKKPSAPSTPVVTQPSNPIPTPVPPQPPIELPREDGSVVGPSNPPTNIRVKDIVNDGSPKAPDWNYLWDNCVVDKTTVAKTMLDSAVKKFIDNRNKYKYVMEKTGVPDWFIAGLHMRESGFDFSGCLHNGDPWNKKTINVPRNRGPWSSWDEAAVDALKYDNITSAKTDTIAKCLEYAFRFNGVGYLKKIGDKGLIEYSPYVAAYTEWHDETSKYKGDGNYDPRAPEKQLGVMAFWKELEVRGIVDFSIY